MRYDTGEYLADVGLWKVRKIESISADWENKENKMIFPVCVEFDDHNKRWSMRVRIGDVWYNTVWHILGMTYTRHEDGGPVKIKIDSLNADGQDNSLHIKVPSIRVEFVGKDHIRQIHFDLDIMSNFLGSPLSLPSSTPKRPRKSKRRA